MLQDDARIELVSSLWANGRPLEAGKVVYENLPLRSRPLWASQILQLVVDRSGIRSPPIDEVLAAAKNEDMWKNGHNLFSAVRTSSLRFDEIRRSRHLSEDEFLFACVLTLAEHVAKVIYNATNPRDEFDEDSGWWIAVSLRYLVDDVWSEESFATTAWLALTFCA